MPGMLQSMGSQRLICKHNRATKDSTAQHDKNYVLENLELHFRKKPQCHQCGDSSEESNTKEMEKGWETKTIIQASDNSFVE